MTILAIVDDHAEIARLLAALNHPPIVSTPEIDALAAECMDDAPKARVEDAVMHGYRLPPQYEEEIKAMAAARRRAGC